MVQLKIRHVLEATSHLKDGGKMPIRRGMASVIPTFIGAAGSIVPPVRTTYPAFSPNALREAGAELDSPGAPASACNQAEPSPVTKIRMWMPKPFG
jgi:hypothetical protein